MQLNKVWRGDRERRLRWREGIKERCFLLGNKMKAGEKREEIDEWMGRGIGSRGEKRESGWMGENMMDEGYQEGLNRQCVSVNMTVSGSC